MILITWYGGFGLFVAGVVVGVFFGILLIALVSNDR